MHTSVALETAKTLAAEQAVYYPSAANSALIVAVGEKVKLFKIDGIFIFRLAETHLSR